MKLSESGYRILKEKPRICELNLEELSQMKENSLGYILSSFYLKNSIDNIR